jgi:hypothetical protein
MVPGKTLDSSCRQNKSPFAIALGDWFPFGTYFLTSQASPNDPGIVIVVIIVIGEAQLVLHIGGIIAQTLYLDRACLPGNNQKPWETPGRYPCKVDVRFRSGVALSTAKELLYIKGYAFFISKRRSK